MRTILIVGATSAIAQACARRWAGTGSSFILAARDASRLQQVAADLAARGAQVRTFELDINDLDRHQALLDACLAGAGTVDLALIAHGTLPDQAACQQSVDTALREFSTNAVSTIALLTRLANQFEAQRAGTLAVISSVAGDRGRPSNYLYGSAKAAVTAFCEGLRGRLFAHGAHVLTIKPGFVDTPMTAGLPLPGPLVASPDTVAADIDRAVVKRRNNLYTPWFWAPIMLIIRSLPAAIFKKLKL
ncbi:MAG: SDR family oxidoreductase [Burkholderiaceae bacterium]